MLVLRRLKYFYCCHNYYMSAVPFSQSGYYSGLFSIWDFSIFHNGFLYDFNVVDRDIGSKDQRDTPQKYFVPMESDKLRLKYIHSLRMNVIVIVIDISLWSFYMGSLHPSIIWINLPTTVISPSVINV
ncbi:uncharacterized protein EV154DRAFT_550274 [Mucor mucedo]|uniref:uncharacterized protein n=1 Tax=Mucor mucedo TaxID=29922 RepID=UPI00222046AB|nr:uncharacterized protein EV154DRAFT_550274 [Mucor mucedo]KAI7893101.1 hypothetical protein EV154DRAFT_550274 [Mucor mucedo]